MTPHSKELVFTEDIKLKLRETDYKLEIRRIFMTGLFFVLEKPEKVVLSYNVSHCVSLRTVSPPPEANWEFTMYKGSHFDLKMFILLHFLLPLITTLFRVKCPFLLVVSESALRIPLQEEKYGSHKLSFCLKSSLKRNIPDAFNQPLQQLAEVGGLLLCIWRSTWATLEFLFQRKHTKHPPNSQTNETTAAAKPSYDHS